MVEFWTSYAGSDSSGLMDEIERSLGDESAVVLKRYMRSAELASKLKLDKKDDTGDQDAVVQLSKDELEPIGSQFKSNWYYLSPGDSLKTLAREIGSAARVVLVLSDNYFLSRWCLAELAYVLHYQVASDVLIVDNRSVQNDLSGVFRGHTKVNCCLPSGKCQPMKLVDALTQTVKAHESNLEPEIESEFFNNLLDNFSERLYCGAGSVKAIVASCKKISKKWTESPPEELAVNQFNTWCRSDTLARQFCRDYQLQACAELIVNDCSDDIEIESSDGQENLSLEGAIEDFIEGLKGSNRSIKQKELQEFTATLGGFLALPMIANEWKQSVNVSPKAARDKTVFVNLPNDDQHVCFKGLLARAALIGSCIKVSLPKEEDALLSARNVDHIKLKPAMANSNEASVNAEKLVADLWCNSRDFTRQESKKRNSNGLSLSDYQLANLRATLRKQKRDLGEGNIVLLVEPHEFDAFTEDWSTCANKVMDEINRGCTIESDKIELGLLVVQVRQGSQDVLVDGDKPHNRARLIQDILKTTQ